MIFPSIRARVLALAVIPTTAASIIFFGYFVTKQNSDIENHLTTHGNNIASHLASASEYGIFSGNTSLLNPLVDNAFKKDNVTSVTVSDAQGAVLIQRPTSTPPTKTNKQRSTSNSRIFSKPILQNPVIIDDFEKGTKPSSTIIGWVVIEISNDAGNIRKLESTIETLLITLMILASSIYLGTLISRRITKPILALTYAIKQIELGNLNVPINTYSTGELLSLEKGIKGMLHSLKSAQNASQQQIDQATIELRESLELVERKNYDLTVARQAALSSSQAKSSFLANISHEIRTPMNGILGFVRLLNNTPLSGEQADYLHTIEQSSHNLLRIINDVLDLSKVEAGKLTIRKAPFNLRDCIEDVEILVSPSINEKGLEISTLFYDDTPESLVGPQDRIRQVLINLIGNAIKFTENGIIVVRAMLESKDNNGLVIKISVTDQGAGISQKDQQILFDSFTQLDESDTRQHGGAGLGLSISKTLAKAMGGEIGVESHLNEGSTFWFTFKCSLPKNENTLIEKEKPFTGKSVGLYDSHEISRLCISHAFRKLGFTIQEYENIDELIRNTSNGDQPDIYTLNLSIDDLQSLNKLPTSTDINKKIIAIINVATTKTITVLRDHNITNYLTRPFRMSDLISTLSKVTQKNISETSPSETNNVVHPITQQQLADLSILVTEDNPINARFVSTILNRSGAKTTIVDNGKKAIDEFRKNKFDIILMDIHMPIMDGLEATKKIRELEDGKKRIPILGLTAIAVDNEKIKYKNAGLDDVLEKPISVDELLHEINYRVHTKNIPPNTEKKEFSESSNKSNQLGIDKGLSSTMNEMLLAELPETKSKLQQSYIEEDWPTLQNEVHRFLGGMSYCNVPHLQMLTIEFQKALKRQDNKLSESFEALISGIDSLISANKK